MANVDFRSSKLCVWKNYNKASFIADIEALMILFSDYKLSNYA